MKIQRLGIFSTRIWICIFKMNIAHSQLRNLNNTLLYNWSIYIHIKETIWLSIHAYETPLSFLSKKTRPCRWRSAFTFGFRRTLLRVLNKRWCWVSYFVWSFINYAMWPWVTITFIPTYILVTILNILNLRT